MLRLTLRNLFARKVRLLMSTLAIVLGIGFLSGVLTFSTGLNSTFDSIFKGSTPKRRIASTRLSVSEHMPTAVVTPVRNSGPNSSRYTSRSAFSRGAPVRHRFW